MKLFTAQIREVQQTGRDDLQAVISLPANNPSKPGQYFQAHRLLDRDSAVPTTLYPGGISTGEDVRTLNTAPPIPDHWQPGDQLLLRGPLGNGFELPDDARRLALAALGEQCAHLLPLAGIALSRGGEVALFTGHVVPRLPSQVEVSPLAELEAALKWADFLAVSGSPEQIAALKLELSSNMPLRCPAQALVLIPMPCGGMGCCGVCALPDDKGRTLLACEDGPVLEWGRLPSIL